MPLLISCIKDIPTFEIMSISLITSFVVTLIQINISGKLKSMKTNLRMTLVGTFAVSLTSAMYITAFKFAPPVHVELVMFIWPIIVILGNVIFFNEKISLIKSFAIALCFFAILLIHYENLANSSFNTVYYLGYLLTLGASLTWACYNVYARSSTNTSSELMGVYSGLGACLIIPIHFIVENSVALSSKQLILIIIMGIFSQSLAYQAWDYAVKNVPPIRMTNIAYFTPLISVILLITFGFGTLTQYVFYSCMFLLIASFLISPREGRR
jgi:drug/metabolite transporter (DMT)-like permease